MNKLGIAFFSIILGLCIIAIVLCVTFYPSLISGEITYMFSTIDGFGDSSFSIVVEVAPGTSYLVEGISYSTWINLGIGDTYFVEPWEMYNYLAGIIVSSVLGVTSILGIIGSLLD